MMQRLLRAQHDKRTARLDPDEQSGRNVVTRMRDRGFTLIELLVVITILGILAAVVVFSVAGIGDKGKAASIETDATNLRTAEEAYCNQKGSYGSLDALRGVNPAGPSFLATDPKYNAVVTYPTSGGCGNTAYTIGQTSTFVGSAGPRMLAASNNTPGFSFLAADFITANSPVQFLYGSSGGFRTAITTTDAHDDDVLFASADLANVNGVIDSAAGGGASCVPAAGPPAVVCPGVAATKTHYATGRLVAFACRANGIALPPANGGTPGCKQPSGGFVDAPADLAAIVADVNGGGKLLAYPRIKAGALVAGDLPTPVAGTQCPCNAPTATNTAPYGFAAIAALMSPAASGGGGLDSASVLAFLNDTAKATALANVTDTQTAVVTGAAHYALLPKSFVVSPGGIDSNYVVPKDRSGAVTALPSTPIDQYAVVLDHGTGPYTQAGTDQALAWAFLNYMRSDAGRAVLRAHGYEPAP